MADQFISGVAAGKKSSDDICLFCNGVADRNAKDKRHDRNYDIKKYDHHCAVASHIIPGKCDCLVEITRNEFFQRNILVDCFHQIIRYFFFFFLCRRFIVVFPRIAVFYKWRIQRFKCFGRYNSNSEFDRIKHGIVVVLKETAVIRKSNESGNFPTLCITFQCVSDGNLIVVSIHTIDGDFICRFWKYSFHEAGKIHLLPVCKNTHCAAIC